MKIWQENGIAIVSVESRQMAGDEFVEVVNNCTLIKPDWRLG